MEGTRRQGIISSYGDLAVLGHVTRTIANLEGAPDIRPGHVSKAITNWIPDRKSWER